MANTILLRNNTTAEAVPLSATFAAVNEILYNSTDGILYMKKADNTVLAFHADDGTYSLAADEGVANGIATLDGDGKLLTAQLPDLSITETFVVANQSEMLALDAQQGDVAVRTDESKNYILSGSDASQIGDWTELLVPTDTVLSVAGRTGNIVLAKADITDFDDADYATAAQGALAGSAVQPGDSNMNAKQDSLSDGTYTTVTTAATSTITVTSNDGAVSDGDLLGTSSGSSWGRVDINGFSNIRFNTAWVPGNTYRIVDGDGDVWEFELASITGGGTTQSYVQLIPASAPTINPDGAASSGHFQDFTDINNSWDGSGNITDVTGGDNAVDVNVGTVSEGSATKLPTAADVKSATDAIASDVTAIETKTDFISVTQAVDLDSMESDLSAAQADITNIETKTDFISVTQAVDLDDVESKANAAAVAADLATAGTVGKGSDLIEVNDSGSKFTATNLTDVLIELDDRATTGIGADTITQAMMQDNSVGTAEIIDANVTEAKLSASVNASLDLADSAMQSISAASVTETELNASVNASLDLADSAVQDGDTLDGGVWS